MRQQHTLRHDVPTEDACAVEWNRRNPFWRYTVTFGQRHFYDTDAAIRRHDNRLHHLTLIRELTAGDIAHERYSVFVADRMVMQLQQREVRYGS